MISRVQGLLESRRPKWSDAYTLLLKINFATVSRWTTFCGWLRKPSRNLEGIEANKSWGAPSADDILNFIIYFYFLKYHEAIFSKKEKFPASFQDRCFSTVPLLSQGLWRTASLLFLFGPAFSRMKCPQCSSIAPGFYGQRTCVSWYMTPFNRVKKQLILILCR